MKKFLKALWGIIILLLLGSGAAIAYRKPKQLKQLKKTIKRNKKQEAQIKTKLEAVDQDRQSNRDEIDSLEQELSEINQQINDAQQYYDSDDIKAAEEFLRSIGAGNE